MDIAEAQKEIRVHFVGGFYGQLVATALWALSGALATLASPSWAMLALVGGGFLIFPLTELLTRLQGTPKLSPTNELKGLGMQIAFVLPVSMLLLVPVVRYSHNLFYPALLILLGAHYLPFVFLYGMRIYAGLSAVLGLGGVGIALASGGRFTTGAWYGAAALFLFSLLAKAVVAKEQNGMSHSKT